MTNDTPTDTTGLVSDDDDEKLIAELAMPADHQIVWLGLAVAALMLFGSVLWGWAFGEDALDDVASMALVDADDDRCRAVLDSLEESDLSADAYSGVRCRIDGGRVFLTGRVDSEFDRTAVRLAAGAAGFAGGALLPDVEGLFVRNDGSDTADDGDQDQAASPTTDAPDATTSVAPTTSTTAAPTTSAAPTTTAAPATTAAPQLTTLGDALASGGSTQFADIAALLGIDLTATTDAAGNELNRTLFAPSDAAFEAFGADELAALSADPEAARALINYHIVEGVVASADLPGLVGSTVQTLNGLPITFSSNGDLVILNGVSTVATADLQADNGLVHIIDRILLPPTVNEVVGLENIEFEVNSAVITAAGQAELQKAIEFFTASSGVGARIDGHTDTDGDEALNLDLSERRAEAVKQFLVDNGVDGELLTTLGFGETQPVLVDGVEDKAASRRIEFMAR